MKYLNRCILLQLFLTVTGCATQSSLDSVRNDVETLNTRMISVEKDLGGTREESKERIGSFEKSNEADVAAIRKLLADSQAKSYSTREEMESINGKLDDLSLAVKKSNEESQRYRQDADQRIATLQDSIVKLESSNNDLNNKVAEVAQLEAATQTPDSIYTQGVDTFKAGDMPGARKLLQKFIELNTHHALAPNAFYWIGESYYSEKNYDQAILTFQNVIKNYPKNEQVPSAMLKQATAFKAINDNKSARFVLKGLVDGYPKSEEAKQARKLLNKIR